MPVRILFILTLLIFSVFSNNAKSADESVLTFIDVFATNPGESSRIGRFPSNQQIDILYQFEINVDRTVPATLTLNITSPELGKIDSRSVGANLHPGMKNFRLSFIPEKSSRNRTYHIYASIKADGEKHDKEFDIQVERTEGYPGIGINEVKLTPRSDSKLQSDLKGAAIPYNLEIEFNVEFVINTGYAEIRWICETPDGFILDQGIAASSTLTGKNEFKTESILARPSATGKQSAVFTVTVSTGIVRDVAAFPIESLPVSLSDFRTRDETGSIPAQFSIGEACMITSDGARASTFRVGEAISSRIICGGIIPENTMVLVGVTDTDENIVADFRQVLPSGTEYPFIEIPLTTETELVPGIYKIFWTIFVDNVMFAQRNANFTVSAERGMVIPNVIQLPGNAKITPPLDWHVVKDPGAGKIAAFISDKGITSEVKIHDIDEPLKPSVLADIYESDPATSKLDTSFSILTSDNKSLEGVYEFERRAWFNGTRIIINTYWIYRVGDGQYQFLIVSSTGSNTQVEETYAASDALITSLTFN